MPTIRYREFVRDQKKLAEALQRRTQEELGEIPVMLQTPAERRKSAAEVRSVVRAVERSIVRRKRDEERMQKIPARGQY